MKQLTQNLWRTAVVFGLGVPGVALAAPSPFENAQNLVNQTGTAAGLQNKPLEQMVGSIINVVLGFLGIVLLGLLLYAGFTWMTAGGDEDKVKKAKGMITNAIIGLVIIVAAFAISSFVLGSLVNVTKQ
jgi:hypothetical protein